MSKKMSIVVSHGTLDAAYVALNIALTGRALDAEVNMFFTFEGVNIIRKGAADTLPGSPTQPHIRQGLEKSGTPPVSELLAAAVDSGINIVGCQMTLDVMGIAQDTLIDGIETGGATTFLASAFESDVNLHV